MNQNKFLLLLIFILFISLAGCAKDKSDINDEVVAKADKGYVVTVKDLKNFVAEGHYDRKISR